MKTLKAITIILLVIFSSALVVAEASVDDKSDLEVLDIKMEPIRQSRGWVSAKVRNNSDQEKAYDIGVRAAKSPRAGWQTQFPHVIAGGTTQSIRHAYGMLHPISALQWVRLRFYAVGTGTDARGRRIKHLFKEVTHTADDVGFAAADEGEFEPTSEGKRAAIAETLRKFQVCVRNKDYESAWQFLSQDFKDAESAGYLSTFQESMEKPYWMLFPLSRTEVLALEPKSAGRRKDILALTTALEDKHWMVNFVKVGDKWRIDSLERIDATPKEEIALEPKAQEQALLKTLEQWQHSIRDRKDEVAWGLMASAWRRKGRLLGEKLGNDRQRFTDAMRSNEGLMRTIWANLRPESVTDMKMGASAVLNTGHASVPWVIDFVMEDGRWKINHIERRSGGDWQARLLPKMQKRVTEHFDIFYFKGSTAEKEIDQIAERRDRGFREISRFLGNDSDVRLRMILFEDGATKYSHTGHRGMGLASGTMVVEIYNEKQKLNPHHETAHILTGPYGSPPALFNEGLATYISERLGSHALATLGGGESSIYERVRELNGKGELIELEELLTYTEIGSGESKPTVAYPEAASFVKFLIDTYGKGKFLRAYRTLRGSSDESVQQQNVEDLQGIYGKSLEELNKRWKRATQGAVQD